MPPVMSKLTLCQLTDNAEEFNKSISLMQSSRRGAKTPNQKTNNMEEKTGLAEQSLIISQGLGKASSYTDAHQNDVHKVKERAQSYAQ